MKIYKQLFLFFLPILIGTFVQQLYSTVDTIIVGRFVGTIALASVGGSVAIITEITISFFNGLASGAAVTIGQYYGENNKDKLYSSILNAYLLACIIGIILTVFGIIFTPYLLKIMNTPTEMFSGSCTYLKVYFSGILFILFYNIGSYALRAIGDSRHPLIYLLVCSFVNIILDLIFVCIFNLGIFGVSLATIIAQAISAFLIIHQLNKSLYDFNMRSLVCSLNFSILKKELLIGIPEALQACAYGFSNIIIQISVNSFGTHTIAAWGIYGKLDLIFWSVASALGITVTTFTSQSFGANKKSQIFKIIRINTILSYLICCPIILILFIFCKTFYQFFTINQDVILLATNMLRFLAPSYLISILLENLTGGLRGMGDVFFPTSFTFAGIFLIRLPWIILITQKYHTLNNLLISYPLAWGFTILLLIPYYLIKKKKFLNTF